MGKILLVLAWLACPIHGTTRWEQHERSHVQEEQRLHLQKALAALLFASHPATAFQLPGLSGRFLRSTPKVAGSQRLLGQRAPLMNELHLTPEEDPSVPRPGVPVPEKDDILRDLRVTKVEDVGVWVEVDPDTGLNGFIYPMGLDNAYIKSIVNTFRVGDRIDALVVELSGLDGRLLLSRKILMDREGWEKHELPRDGRERPRRRFPKPEQKSWGWGDSDVDPCVPMPGVITPPPGTVLRGMLVTNVTDLGVVCMIDESQNMHGFIHKLGLDIGSFEDLDETFKIGDVLDAKSLGVSKYDGKLMLARKPLMMEEGPEKHALPDDGRVLPVYD